MNAKIKKFQRLALSFTVALVLFTAVTAPTASADSWESGEACYSVFGEDGKPLFQISGAVYQGDEYISGDNKLYRVTSVDDGAKRGVAKQIGDESMPDVSWLKQDEAVAVYADNGKDNKKLVAIYATHTDESYVPTDGTQSATDGKGGIFDVCEALKTELEGKGIDVQFDDTTHVPHDAGAYRRSRQTATRLAQKNPDALIDVHRDGIPAPAEYTDTIDGEPVTKIRLEVGRSNQNAAANRAFAKQIKAVADKEYPGLIKDIFIGKGTYNQDVYPHAILMEFGTHTTSKERAVRSTAMMADVLDKTLYGQVSGAAKDGAAGGTGTGTGAGAQTGGAKRSNEGTSSGVIWMLVIAGIAILAFAFLATGTGKGMREKIMRNTSEITGGLVGKKPDEQNKKK